MIHVLFQHIKQPESNTTDKDTLYWIRVNGRTTICNYLFQTKFNYRNFVRRFVFRKFQYQI